MSNQPHVYVAIPAYGCQTHIHFATSLLKLQTRLAKEQIPMTTELMGNESLITRGRSILVEKFLKTTKATHFLFIDSDIVFNEETILRMLRSDRDIVCGPYSKKGLMYNDIYQLENPTVKQLQTKGIGYNINFLKQSNHPVDNGFMEVLEAATGMMMIKRHVLEKLRDKHTELVVKNDIPGSRDSIPEYCMLFDTMICPESRRFLSEDYAFCRLARDAGFSIFIDCLATLGHVGNVTRQTNLKKRLST